MGGGFEKIRKGALAAFGAAAVLGGDPVPLDARLRQIDEKARQEEQYSPTASSVQIGQESRQEQYVDRARSELEASQRSIDLYERIWGAYKIEVGRLAKLESENPTGWRALVDPDEPLDEPEDSDVALAWRHGFGLLRRMDRAQEGVAQEIAHAMDGDRLPSLRSATRAAIEHIAALWAEFQKIPQARGKERALAFKHFFETRFKKPVVRDTPMDFKKQG